MAFRSSFRTFLEGIVPDTVKQNRKKKRNEEKYLRLIDRDQSQ